MNPRARYEKLIARAKDQAGTPEGDLCERFAERLLLQYPDIQSGRDLKTSHHEFRWSTEHERNLLIRLAAYLELDALINRARPRLQVIFVEADTPTAVAMRQTYEVMRRRIARVVEYAALGFMMGALPVASDNSDGDHQDNDIDDDLIAIGLSAMEMGSNHCDRKAITDG